MLFKVEKCNDVIEAESVDYAKIKKLIGLIPCRNSRQCELAAFFMDKNKKYPAVFVNIEIDKNEKSRGKSCVKMP